MKKHMILMTTGILAALTIFSCSFIGGQSGVTGLYLGIVAFNNGTTPMSIGPLNSNTDTSYKSFINALEMDDSTTMYHAINEAIDMLQAASLPDDVTSVNLITVTDGVDQGSYDLNAAYDNNSEYLAAIQDRFADETVNGIKIDAYSCGVEGNYPGTPESFESSLESITANNGYDLSGSLDTIIYQFQALVEQLSTSSSAQNMSITLPAVNPSDVVCFTFDSLSPVTSALYIQGTFNNSAGVSSLTGVTYGGMSSGSGTSITGTNGDGVEKIFNFENIALDSGDMLETTNIQLWLREYNDADGTWGDWVQRGEFDSDNATLTTVTSSSAVFVFVLDASSSLGTDFSRIQTMANDTIDTMIESYNYE